MTPSVYRKAIAQIKSVPQELQWHLLEFIRVLTGITFQGEPEQQLSVKGTYRNGSVELAETIDKPDGQAVIVTFLDQVPAVLFSESNTWAELDDILNECQISTGINDLAHQHDHYIHGVPKD
ncbi:MAG: hypothetical protein AAF151_04780 [Cyanobacteria bacterium J06656_5]